MIVLHIGFHKTGTTTVQGFLAANAARLEQAGIAYPTAGRGDGLNHRNLAVELAGSPQFRAERGGWADIVALAAADPHRVIILSAEAFSRLTEPEVARLRSRLGEVPVKIVAYVRDLAGWIMSRYGQRTKAGVNVGDFDAAFAEMFAAGVVRFHDTLSAWATHFGWPAIRVRSLDRAILVDGDILADFLSVLGLDGRAAERMALERPGDLNVTPPWPIVELIRALNIATGAKRARDLRPDLAPDGAAKTAIERSSLPGRIREHCLSIAAKAAYDAPPIQYLTPEQDRLCRDLDREQAALLLAAGGDVRLTDGAGRALGARPAVPDFAAVPAPLRAEMLFDLACRAYGEEAESTDSIRHFHTREQRRHQRAAARTVAVTA